MYINLSEFNGNKSIYSFTRSMEMVNILRQRNLNVLYNNDYKCYLYPDGACFNISHDEKVRLDMCWNEDVFQFSDTRAFVYYSNESDDNAIMITGKCNSNCIMCPAVEQVRKNAITMNINELLEIARHLPNNNNHITITGGEPFLLGKDLFKLLSYLKKFKSEMHYLLLTNGRIFYSNDYCKMLAESSPYNIILGIPIHGYNSETHDYITQSIGSYKQTCIGIKNLLYYNINIELRFVVSKLNMDFITQMANTVIQDFPTINCVKIMGLEMLGNAAINKDRVWIDYKTAFAKAKEGINTLINHGINVELYNFPLCMVDSKYWGLYRKSISNYKRRYLPSCERCKEKEACGGIFAGTIRLVDRVIPI